MPAPQALVDLVARFEEQLEAYKSGSYNETQLRIDFLDPLFTLLGWDMHNASGHAEAYRDVIHEDEVRVGGALKAPDYGFRIGGTRKFFLEAKKPSVVIKDEIQPAYQLRRYAWSAKLPLSILSDFEEFAIYDCRIKPKPNDKASTARIFYCTYRDYVEKWDEIAAIFSKDAILKGSFDKYASGKGRRGTAEVDEDFLSTIEEWRSNLADDLAIRNPALTERDLNFSVQKILDRIIFLRICEDRGMEDYGRLRALASGPRIYPRLTELFRAADTRYNSGLFHFQPEKGRDEGPDELTLDLEVDDKLLRGLLRQLYYPECPYEFRVLSSDILGQVYEQFLGKVIRLTPSHKAKVDDKPEVKKVGGVYYTPTYIVDYIVRETVGVLVEGKTPKQIASIRVLDPACGSGSFLIGAYQFLLDWYLKYYIDHDPAALAKGKRPVLIQTPGGWRLSIEERKRILLAHIHGVDIDSQAVEVTKLSLLLKVLEGETSQSLQPLFQIFHERALPDLGNNIKCGNSLIGSNFYAQPDLPVLSDEDKLRVNVFDWDGPRGFPQIMKEGGFDAIIGNPPYIRIQILNETQPESIEYFKRQYKCATQGNYDIYVLFIERTMSLFSSTGKSGFILPHKFFTAEYGIPLRKMLSTGKHLHHLVHFGDKQIFSKATTYTCLLFLDKKESKNCRFVQVKDLHEWITSEKGNVGTISGDAFKEAPWKINVGPDALILDRLSNLPKKLKNAARLFVGLQTDADDVFILEEISRKNELIECLSASTGQSHWFELSHLKPFLKGSLDIKRYGFSGASKWLIFPYKLEQGHSVLIPTQEYINQYPLTWKYLETNHSRLAKRAKGILGNKWYGYVYKKNHARFEQSKILAPAIATGSCFSWDPQGHYYFVGSGGGGGGGYGIILDPEVKLSPLFLLGILNSRLVSFFLKKTSSVFRGGYIALNRQYIEDIPLPNINPHTPPHDRVVSLAEEMLTLHRKRTLTKNPPEQAALDAQITATDIQIDRLVYSLYGLTEDEIRIVEAAG